MEVLKANSELSHIHIQSMLRRWFMETEGTEKVPPAPPSRGIPWPGHPESCHFALPSLHCSVGAALRVKCLMGITGLRLCQGSDRAALRLGLALQIRWLHLGAGAQQQRGDPRITHFLPSDGDSQGRSEM